MTQDQIKTIAESRTQADLLAAALVGEYPALDAIVRYADGLASPYDKQTILTKFKQHQAKHLAPQPDKSLDDSYPEVTTGSIVARCDSLRQQLEGAKRDALNCRQIIDTYSRQEDDLLKLQSDLAAEKLALAYKNDTANTFMNQVKRLQSDLVAERNVSDLYHEAWIGYKTFPSMSWEREFDEAETAHQQLRKETK